jgi:hypothetical protein
MPTGASTHEIAATPRPPQELAASGYSEVTVLKSAYS